MSVPNQSRIIIQKEKCDKNHTYALLNIEALHQAMLDLSGETFKLWIYFTKNQKGYQFDLSQVEANKWGIKKDSYYSAVKKLKEKGYLNSIKEGSNIYIFSKIPKRIENGYDGDSEIPKKFSEKTKEDSEIQKSFSEIQKDFSEKQERNNTNNTSILQNNTKEYNGFSDGRSGKASNAFDNFPKDLLARWRDEWEHPKSRPLFYE